MSQNNRDTERKKDRQMCMDTGLKQKYKLELPAPKLEIYRKSPHYAAVKFYNHIPKLKSFLAEKAYYSVTDFLNDKFVK